MKPTHVTKKQVWLSTQLHEDAWAETDIFARTTDVAPKLDDHLRIRFEWGF